MADDTKATTSTTTVTTPIVIRDPRFKAGRSLVQKGLAQEGAIEIFATLVEEASTKYGESSIETAPAYYEYGNALVRAASRAMAAEETEALEPAADVREAAAAAAEERLKQTKEDDEGDGDDENGKEDEDSKPAAKEDVGDEKGDDDEEDGGDNNEDEENDGDEEDRNDLNLALEMMENAFSILEEYKDKKSEDGDDEKPYLKWASDEWPRILLGIGDTLAALERHADAADAYSRVLEFRQSQLGEFDKEAPSVEQLRTYRRVCEATVLIAEELLACPADEDVVTSETESLIVKAGERVEYARGYYDKARDALQETVFYMGKVAAAKVDLGDEKEDVCFIATMVMGVGESLAAIDEAAAENGDSEPAKKKAKL